VTNVFIVVVRYFGGTKLGASGLINAYKTSAAEALKQAEIIEKKVKDWYAITFDYALMSQVMNASKKLELEVLEQVFENKGYLKVAIRQSEVEEKIKVFRAAVAEVRIEEIDQIETIEGLDIQYLLTV